MSLAHTPAIQPAIFTLEHYEHMVARGVFAGDYESKHVELLDGRIYEKYSSDLVRFTLGHYEHMIAVGAFDEPFNIKVELLGGEIVMMSPIGEPHAMAVTTLTEWSYEVADLEKVMIRGQAPIRMPTADGEPEPDLVWTIRKPYFENHPEPSDVHLLVEVANSSLAKDRGPKLAAYARVGIPEYWIVNLADKEIEIYRDPVGNSYRDQRIVRGKESVSPLILPSAQLSPSRLFDSK